MTIIYDFFNEILIQTGFSTVVLPSLIFMCIMYIFLLKSKIVDSKTVSFFLSFLVFLLLTIFPIITKIDVSIFLSTFFLQSFFVALIFVFGLLLSSVFYPDLPKVLERFQKSRSMMIAVIAIVIVIFITSGALTFLLITLGGPEGVQNLYTGREFPREVSFTLAALVLLLVLAIIMSGVGRMLLKE